MILCKRILLIILLLITLLFVGYQVYLVISPLTTMDNETKYFRLVDDYQVLKMQRLVLEEQYALARTKNKLVQLNNVKQGSNQQILVLNGGFFKPRKAILNGQQISLRGGETTSEPIALSLEQAKTFEQLEAYVSNNKPLQPQPLTKDEKSLLDLPSDNFTLQLMGVRDSSELTRFISDNNLQDAHIFHTSYLNQDWYVLVYGLYKNHAEALKAIDTLPTNIKKLKPWIRQVSNVKKAIQLYR